MNRREFLASTSIITIAAGLGLGFHQPALAQEAEAIFVLANSEVGAPNHDPIRAAFSNMGMYLIYDRLVEQNPIDQSYCPHLAESWETSPDGMSWIFKLRQGVKFHDGEPFNAATVSWWIEKYRDGVNDANVRAIERVEVIDDHTVRFSMKYPEPNLIYNLSTPFMGIPSPKSYDAAGDSYGVTEAVGTGPFKFENFIVGQETALVANEDYNWGSELSQNRGAPYIKRLVLREIPDLSTAFLELKTGGVGLLLAVPNEFLPQLKADSNIGFFNLPGIGVSFLAFNAKSKFFSDVSLRHAVALAIDQGAILKSVFNGIGLESHQFLISALAESKVDPKFEIHHDVDKANQLLDAAGWKPGGDGIRVKDGKRFEIRLCTQSASEFKRTAEIVQTQLRAVGIDAAINTFDSTTIRDQLRRGEYDLSVSHYDWNNADILDWQFSAKNIPYPNTSMWDDLKSEELRETAVHHSKNAHERTTNFIKYQEWLLNQYAFVPVHEPLQNIAFNKTRLSAPEAFLPPFSFSDITVVD